MALKLMYITNDPAVAAIAESEGVDRIFVDLEYIGKSLRQGGMDTVQSRHTVADARQIAESLTKSELLVRVNPIHDKTDCYSSSEEEIDDVVNAGARVIMLPYFKTASEVARFIKCVDGRAKAMLLFETPESVMNIDEILAIPGIDEVFIGLNDLSLGYGKKFMFELLSDGTVDMLVEKFKRRGLPYGFGGLASLEGGLLPGKYVLKEHYRLGSGCVILSRSFCNTQKITDLVEIKTIFSDGLKKIREYEKICESADDFFENRELVKNSVESILARI